VLAFSPESNNAIELFIKYFRTFKICRNVLLFNWRYAPTRNAAIHRRIAERKTVEPECGGSPPQFLIPFRLSRKEKLIHSM
jgi:hypothetical protein